jgi:hypothetical protein
VLNPWFFLALFFMGVNWLAVWFNWKTANYLSKPAIILALLFLFLDVLLAVDRLIWPLATARLWKRFTYQLDQLAIIAGALLTFSA